MQDFTRVYPLNFNNDIIKHRSLRDYHKKSEVHWRFCKTLSQTLLTGEHTQWKTHTVKNNTFLLRWIWIIMIPRSQFQKLMLKARCSEKSRSVLLGWDNVLATFILFWRKISFSNPELFFHFARCTKDTLKCISMFFEFSNDIRKGGIFIDF